jgi:hypothetical protein
MTTPAPTPTPSPTPAPTAAPNGSSRIYLGYYINGVPWDSTKLSTFESLVGKRASIIHWGQAWGAQYPNFSATLAQRVRDHGSIPMINWGSWDYTQGVNQPTYKLSNIIRGDFDAYITKWAQDAKAWGKPLFLRFDHEMNGNWYPWSEQTNGNAPGEYAAMWRHVHDIFTNVGARNVYWVFSPNVIDTYPLTDLYPGDNYVDWVAMDGYNWGGASWKTFTQVFQKTYNTFVQLFPSKPIMIAETGSSENGGSKPNWLTDMLTFQLRAGRWPQIKALVYFDWNDNDAALSWPIESSTGATDAWRTGIADPYFAANDFASITQISSSP